MLRLNVDMKSSAASEPLTIGEAAASFGLAAHVLRHWESVGLLSPARVSGDRRRYGRDDMYRIAVILRAKEAGLGLEEIGEMITAGPQRRKEVLRRRRAELIAGIEKRRAALEMVERGLECGHEDFMACPTFRARLDELVG